MDLSPDICNNNKLTLHNIFFKHIKNKKKLANDIVQLLTKIINVEHLLYTYPNVMQQLYGSSCGLFTITYVIDIAFILSLEQFIYIVPKM